MRIAFITDIHEVTTHLDQFKAAVGEIDLLVIGGDLTNFGGAARARAILGAIRDRFDTVLSVIGNLDEQVVIDLFETEGVSLNGRGVIIDGVGFFGVGGSNRTPMKTPTELDEDAIADLLQQGFRDVETTSTKVLVSHCPPHQTSTDRLFTGKHVGSTAVRELLERSVVDLCLCGHIHESVALDNVSGSQVCNPGPFSSGCYATVEISNGEVTCKLERLPLGRGDQIRNAVGVGAGKALGFIRSRRR